MITDYIRTCYKKVKKKVMGSRGSDNVWDDNIGEIARTFVSFVQLFSDETTTTLKSTAMIAYHLQAIVSNAFARRR